jgi:hypothetical protein
LHIVDAPLAESYSRSWLWIPGSLVPRAPE